MPKSLEEVQSFMNRQRLASFATIGSDIEPHVVPVFLTYEEGKLYVQTDRKSVKVRNPLRSNNVAVAVYSPCLLGKGRVVRRYEEFIKRTQDNIHKYKPGLGKNSRNSLGIPLFNKKVSRVTA